MTTIDTNRPHWSFWLLGVIALIWNALGCANYLMQLNADLVAQMPQTHRAIIEARPAWATAGFALAVFAGAIGAVLLLLRKRLAIVLFAISLIGVLMQLVHTVAVVRGSSVTFASGELAMMLVMPVIVAIVLLWYARRYAKRGWL